VGLVKNTLKYSQDSMVKRMIRVVIAMQSHMIIKLMICVMNVKLEVYEVSALWRKNGASLMNELSTQDKRIRATTTLVNSRICCFANRSHGQSIVVIKDILVKGRTKWTVASKKISKINWYVLKLRKRDFTLIATHAKLEIVDSGVTKSFSSPIKSMAKRTFNIHLSKAVNFPSRIERLASNGKA
jgi:hypothetical protein